MKYVIKFTAKCSAIQNGVFNIIITHNYFYYEDTFIYLSSPYVFCNLNSSITKLTFIIPHSKKKLNNAWIDWRNIHERSVKYKWKFNEIYLKNSAERVFRLAVRREKKCWNFSLYHLANITFSLFLCARKWLECLPSDIKNASSLFQFRFSCVVKQKNFFSVYSKEKKSYVCKVMIRFLTS